MSERKPTTHLHLRIGTDAARMLGELAEVKHYRRNGLAEAILMAWLARPSMVDVERIMHVDRTRIQAKALAVAELREKIVKGWRVARSRSRGGDIGQITNNYLAVVKLEHGVAVARATLFIWDREYRKAGISGLVDRRIQRGAEDEFKRGLGAGRKAVEPRSTDKQRRHRPASLSA
jgi:hypothetical protein